MKTSRFFLSIAVCAMAVVSIGAQAAGIDVPGFIATHQDIFAGLSMLALAGEVKNVDPEAITRELKRIGDDVKQIGEKALAEAKKAGELSAETKGKVDELLVKQGELQARLQEAEQKLDRRGGDEDEGAKSIGAQFIDSEGFKSWHAAGGMKTSRDAFAFRVKAITSDPASAGDGIAPNRLPGVQTPPMRRMTVRDLITPGRTESPVVQYLQESGFTNNAATVAENVKKPESNITYDLKNATVVTIAHFIKATKQILDDFAQLQSQIDGRLRYGLELAEEAQLLNGSGVGNNLLGIRTGASAYVAPIAVANATRIDILRLALLQAELAEYPSTGIVLHPSDWAAIELLKDTTGAYIFANPQSLAQPGLWGRPVVTTPAQTVDEFLVGAFQLGAQVFDREDANVVVATQNEDDFVKNMITIRGEERLAMALYRPEAFVKGDLTPAP
ncbi:phage major capsid protein, HK97 family [Paenacidovorax caeni]|uniref:Phage major capsid protein, HK97 family n=1 Tax=Paenacidovorax caeni TaxID=343013 RepID=A0A1I7J956_9BURK|nr:phage major capsid protein [Paenacidovorax caeni]SFU81729.1 phage major capsid protein, HK97 family [Paenacidovorax caeni]